MSSIDALAGITILRESTVEEREFSEALESASDFAALVAAETKLTALKQVATDNELRIQKEIKELQESGAESTLLSAKVAS